MDNEKMTNNEFRMTKEIRSTNNEGPRDGARTVSSFGLCHSFGFRHSSIVIFPVIGHGTWVIGYWLPPLAAALLLAGCVTDAPSTATPPLTYPVARMTNVVDEYHGVKVADPYRWLEDDNSPETKAWVQAENKVTFGYLQGIPELPAIKQRLTTLWNYERYGVPFQEGGRYFFTRNDG